MTQVLVPERSEARIVASDQRVVLTGWWFEGFLLLSGAAMAVLGLRDELYWLIGLFTGLLLLAGLGARGEDRRTLALGGILTLLIAVPITRIADASLLLVEVSAAVVALAALALLAPGRPLPRGSLLVGLLTAALFVTTLFSPDQNALLRFAPFCVSFVPLYLLFGQSGDAVRVRVLRIVVLVALAESLLAMAEPFLRYPSLWAPAQLNALGLPKPLPNTLLPFVRSQGTLAHPLPLGILLALAVGLLARNAVRVPLSARLAGTAVLAGGLLFSGSRNSILLAVVVVAYFFSSRRMTAVRFGTATAVSLLALGLSVATDLLTSATTRDVAASGSVTHRAGAYQAFTNLLADQPIWTVLTGNGWASSSRMFASGILQTDGLGAVDNQLVLILSQGGLIALGLLVTLVVLAVVRSGPVLRPPVLAMVATLFVFDVLVWPSAGALLGLVLAAAVQPAPREPEPQRELQRP